MDTLSGQVTLEDVVGLLGIEDVEQLIRDFITIKTHQASSTET